LVTVYRLEKSVTVYLSRRAPVAIATAGLWGNIATAYEMVLGDQAAADQTRLQTQQNIATIRAIQISIQALNLACMARNVAKKPKTCLTPNSFDGDTMVWIRWEGSSAKIRWGMRAGIPTSIRSLATTRRTGMIREGYFKSIRDISPQPSALQGPAAVERP
jgi:hypothetical protein